MERAVAIQRLTPLILHEALRLAAICFPLALVPLASAAAPLDVDPAVGTKGIPIAKPADDQPSKDMGNGVRSGVETGPGAAQSRGNRSPNGRDTSHTPDAHDERQDTVDAGARDSSRQTGSGPANGLGNRTERMTAADANGRGNGNVDGRANGNTNGQGNAGRSSQSSASSIGNDRGNASDDVNVGDGNGGGNGNSNANGGGNGNGNGNGGSNGNGNGREDRSDTVDRSQVDGASHGKQNQLARTAETFGAACQALAARSDSGTSLSSGQTDLLARCEATGALTGNADEAALDQVGALDVTAVSTQAVVSQTMLQLGVVDRLETLRGAQVKGSIEAPSIADRAATGRDATVTRGRTDLEPRRSLASAERLGFWIRSNYDKGRREASDADMEFRSRQRALTGGLDYRLSPTTVVGLALSRLSGGLSYFEKDQDRVDTSGWMGTLYAAAYPWKDLYVDAVISQSDSNHHSQRYIDYSEGAGTVRRLAEGTTSGDGLNARASVGYDFSHGRVAISPSFSLMRSKMAIDPFSEVGADGLNLAYGRQEVNATIASAAIAMSYALSTRWLVLIPHLRGEYLSEFDREARLLEVSFASAGGLGGTSTMRFDPAASDGSYVRYATGLSAQFKYGLAGYYEYQRLEGYQDTRFTSATYGVRIQRQF